MSLLTTPLRHDWPPVPDTIAALTNVDRTDEQTWTVGLRVSDEMMRRLVSGSVTVDSIAMRQVGDRLELLLEHK